jgi:hypothetical protein
MKCSKQEEKRRGVLRKRRKILRKVPFQKRNLKTKAWAIIFVINNKIFPIKQMKIISTIVHNTNLCSKCTLLNIRSHI